MTKHVWSTDDSVKSVNEAPARIARVQVICNVGHASIL